MTWSVKIRGDSRALIAAEYECPVHGRFEITVPRDQVPDVEGCPHRIPLVCPVFADKYDAQGFPIIAITRPCNQSSPWCFPSPARTRVQRVTAARRGKDPERPAGCMDWQALAYDECSPEEWEAKERKKDWEATRKIVKEALR